MINRLNNLKNKIMNISLSANEIRDILDSEFADLGIEITVNKTKDFPENAASMSGVFNPDDWDAHDNIELFLIVSEGSAPIVMNNTSWKFFQHQLHQTIEHEMIHREQLINRVGVELPIVSQEGLNYKQKRIAYLSNPDEVGAYANDVVLDLSELYTKHGTSLRLWHYETITEKESPILYEYMSLFGKDSKVVNAIVSKAVSIVAS